MPSKNKKKVKIRKSRQLEVNIDAARILRIVGDKEAFYFYETFGKPTGDSARSLSDFLEKIKSVKLESLVFHLQRKDFQNWVRETLGDCELARKIGRIPSTYDENLRTKIQSTVENRIKELDAASVTLLVSQDLAVASRSSLS